MLLAEQQVTGAEEAVIGTEEAAKSIAAERGGLEPRSHKTRRSCGFGIVGGSSRSRVRGTGSRTGAASRYARLISGRPPRSSEMLSRWGPGIMVLMSISN